MPVQDSSHDSSSNSNIFWNVFNNVGENLTHFSGAVTDYVIDTATSTVVSNPNVAYGVGVGAYLVNNVVQAATEASNFVSNTLNNINNNVYGMIEEKYTFSSTSANTQLPNNSITASTPGGQSQKIKKTKNRSGGDSSFAKQVITSICLQDTDYNKISKQEKLEREKQVEEIIDHIFNGNKTSTLGGIIDFVSLARVSDLKENSLLSILSGFQGYGKVDKDADIEKLAKTAHNVLLLTGVKGDHKIQEEALKYIAQVAESLRDNKNKEEKVGDKIRKLKVAELLKHIKALKLSEVLSPILTNVKDTMDVLKLLGVSIDIEKTINEMGGGNKLLTSLEKIEGKISNLDEDVVKKAHSIYQKNSLSLPDVMDLLTTASDKKQFACILETVNSLPETLKSKLFSKIIKPQEKNEKGSKPSQKILNELLQGKISIDDLVVEVTKVYGALTTSNGLSLDFIKSLNKRIIGNAIDILQKASGEGDVNEAELKLLKELPSVLDTIGSAQLSENVKSNINDYLEQIREKGHQKMLSSEPISLGKYQLVLDPNESENIEVKPADNEVKQSSSFKSIINIIKNANKNDWDALKPFCKVLPSAVDYLKTKLKRKQPTLVTKVLDKLNNTTDGLIKNATELIDRLKKCPTDFWDSILDLKQSEFTATKIRKAILMCVRYSAVLEHLQGGVKNMFDNPDEFSKMATEFTESRLSAIAGYNIRLSILVSLPLLVTLIPLLYIGEGVAYAEKSIKSRLPKLSLTSEKVNPESSEELSQRNKSDIAPQASQGDNQVPPNLEEENHQTFSN
ncbi:MAG: hypothetical protein VXW87_03570 [Pseudomonadota bacterium]|nr:hypothetical protein [Pseudomonadota bacterium]